MPCTKCKDGKYKWGETGSCKYATKADCEKANPKHYKKDMADIKENTKITELVIADDANQDLAIDCISLVSEPALMVDFVYMNKQKNNLTLSKIDEHKKQIISPALIPDKTIYRFNAAENAEYFVYFSKATVAQASVLYLKNNNHHKATTQHEERVGGILTVESWLVEDTEKDKSALYGFKMPVGTWMVKLQVTNEDVWQRVLSGELKGLSIEGFFVDKLEKMSKKTEGPTDQQLLTALAEMISPKTKKVELSIMSNIVETYKKAGQLSQQANGKGLSSLRKVVLKVDGDFLQLLRTSEECLDLIGKAKAEIKALGLDIPNELIGYENVLKAYEGDAEYWIKQLNASQYQ